MCDLSQTQKRHTPHPHIYSRQCSQCTAAEPSSTSASVPTLVAGVSKIITWPQPPTADRTASRTGMCDRERGTPSCRPRCTPASQCPQLQPRRGCPSAGPSSRQDGPGPGSGSSAERRRTAQKRGSRLRIGRQFTVANKHAGGLEHQAQRTKDVFAKPRGSRGHQSKHEEQAQQKRLGSYQETPGPDGRPPP